MTAEDVHPRTLTDRSPSRKWPGRLRSVALGLLAGGVAGGPSRADATDANYSEAVRKHLGLFLTVPERREQHERVELRADGTLSIHMVRALPDERREAVLCQGARWLLLGRLTATGGVSALFAEAPEVSGVELVFYTVETSVAPGPDGRYRQTRTERPSARMSLGRERGAGLDKKAVDAMLAPGRCLDGARDLLDELWVR